ncbi:hypothetical protein HOY80DRAFT_156177 [Tuber brumale]|nr:hypothetical protein HOY80DRAFT_156177 [Tuber brumale]
MRAWGGRKISSLFGFFFFFPSFLSFLFSFLEPRLEVVLGYVLSENTTNATIIGCFHVLILKKTVDVKFSSFLIYTQGEFFFFRLGWVCASGV